ncbi:MAG: hypothetical protein IMF10_02020 [Proteobacteria bacterium]|nr:hypothetical protein [Pseudomonadota bacterium]
MSSKEELLQRKKETENKLNVLEKELQNPFLKRDLREKYSKAVDFLKRDIKALKDKVLEDKALEDKVPEDKAPKDEVLVTSVQEKRDNMTEKEKLLQRKKETENKLNMLETELQNPFLRRDLREKYKKVVDVLEKDRKALGDNILIASAREEGLVE